MSDSSSPEQTAIGFVLRLGRALHSAGYPAPSLEGALVKVSARLGLVGPPLAALPAVRRATRLPLSEALSAVGSATGGQGRLDALLRRVGDADVAFHAHGLSTELLDQLFGFFDTGFVGKVVEDQVGACRGE